MNRRSFVAVLASLPLIGRLFAAEPEPGRLIGYIAAIDREGGTITVSSVVEAKDGWPVRVVRALRRGG